MSDSIQIPRIEHRTEDYAVCPWCKNVLDGNDSPFEFFQSEGLEGDTKTAECPKCEKPVHCTVEVEEVRTVHYSTRKVWGEAEE